MQFAGLLFDRIRPFALYPLQPGPSQVHQVQLIIRIIGEQPVVPRGDGIRPMVPQGDGIGPMVPRRDGIRPDRSPVAIGSSILGPRHKGAEQEG